MVAEAEAKYAKLQAGASGDELESIITWLDEYARYLAEQQRHCAEARVTCETNISDTQSDRSEFLATRKLNFD